MATASPATALGLLAPPFQLPDVRTGDVISLDTFAGAPALLVTFICRHCPYVQHVKDELARLGHDYPPRGVAMVAIGSNDAAAYPDDSPESLAEMAVECGFTFPICHDETQEVARAYGAVCTPDTFLFDGDRRLVYRGRLDGSRPGSGEEADGREIRAALDTVLAGRPVPAEQRPSIGCSIKWKQR